MSKATKIIAPILVIIGAIVLVQVMVAGKPAPEKKESSQRTVSLHVAPVVKTSRSIDVETQGEVKAKNQIPLTARVSGHIIEISPDFEEGAAIDSDTLLLKIDDTDYKAAVIRAQARLAEARVALERELANEKIKKTPGIRKKATQNPPLLPSTNPRF